MNCFTPKKLSGVHQVKFYTNTMLSLDQLENLWREGVDVTEEEMGRITHANKVDGGLLRTAAEEGYLNVVKFFFKAKDRWGLTSKEKEMFSNIGAADNEGNTPLHFAASSGHASIVQYIISATDIVDTKNRHSETAFYLACREGHESVVKVLFDRGANRNPYSLKDEKTPIECSAANGHAAIVKLLLNSGAEGSKALFFAAEAGHEDIVALLLQHCWSSGLSVTEYRVLHVAARQGHARICHMLLDAGADMSWIDMSGLMPIEHAAKQGRSDIVQLLFSRAASAKAPLKQMVPSLELNTRDSCYEKALRLAIVNGRIATARLLLSHGCTLNKILVLKEIIQKGRFLALWALLAMGEDQTSVDSTTPLHIACAGNHVEVVKFILQRNASINAQDSERNTPLHSVCKSNGSEHLVKLLLSHGADVNKINKDGRTPLQVLQYFPLQKILIESGADPNVVDAEGWTLLHEASNVELVRLLLQCNVLVDVRSVSGITPLMKACSRGLTNIAEILLENGAYVNSRIIPLNQAVCHKKHDLETLVQSGESIRFIYATRYETALHLACKNNDINCTLLLLKWNAEVNAKNKFGLTPLHMATRAGAVSVIQLLADHGAEINGKDNFGRTALHLVMCEETTRLLLRNGADTSIQDQNGQTPLDMAENNAREEVVRVLLEHVSQSRR